MARCACGVDFQPNSYRQVKCNACRFKVIPPTPFHAISVTPPVYGPEIWADVTGYGQRYAVSTWGKVYSPHWHRLLKGSKRTNGLFVGLLQLDGSKTVVSVARLVMMTFNPISRMNERMVCPINGDVWDTHLENLWWTDARRATGGRVFRRRGGR